jgi:hypothetical protein
VFVRSFKAGCPFLTRMVNGHVGVPKPGVASV